LKDAVAVGGLSSDKFMAEEPRHLEDELHDLIPRVHDKKLRAACEQFYAEYKLTFGAAPPKIGPRVYVLDGSDDYRYGDEDRQCNESRAREMEHAHAALDAADGVLARLNKLERWLPAAA
jgi:hypothetical protein